MNISFMNIKSYLDNKEENIFIKSFYYSVIIGVLLILIIVFSSYKKKDLYYENVLYIKDNNIILTIPINELELIVNNKKLIIYENEYFYKILDIELVNKGEMYYQIKINLKGNNLDYNKFNYTDALFEYKILLKEESILRYIVRIIIGE